VLLPSTRRLAASPRSLALPARRLRGTRPLRNAARLAALTSLVYLGQIRRTQKAWDKSFKKKNLGPNNRPIDTQKKKKSLGQKLQKKNLGPNNRPIEKIYFILYYR
jgi:hypothetical protein